MSDRLAVFNDGRIEQVGTPADVYEQPETEFVAGFVGVSNVLERDGRRFTIRPEKIRMADRRRGRGRRGVEPGQRSQRGRLRRDGHALRRRRSTAAATLVVVRQNLETSSQDALAEQGRRVRLSWRPEHTYEIEKEGT